MIRGLTWIHVFWVTVFTYVLVATASASNPYELNHQTAADAVAAVNQKQEHLVLQIENYLKNWHFRATPRRQPGAR